MSYEIRPLEWEPPFNTGAWREVHRVSVAGNVYYVGVLDNGFMSGESNLSEKTWAWSSDSLHWNSCASLEAGKEACEADWRRRIEACLVPVGWREIESAPRDGQSVLVWCPERKSTYAAIWDESLGEWSPFGSRDTYISRPVTHWMPLPEPPEVQG